MAGKYGTKKTLLIVFLSLLLILTACASGNNGGNKTDGSNSNNPGTTSPSGGTGTSGDNNSTETSKPAEDPNKLLTLEWLTYQYGPVDDDAPAKKMLEERFNVKFNIWYIDVTKRDELLGVRLAAGEIPDFMTVYSSADLVKFLEQGIITGYTEEELNTYMPNYKKLIDKYDPNIWKYAKYGDQYIGIPSIAEGGVSLAVAWRKDWLENVGIAKIPVTLEETEEALYKFRNNDPDRNGKKDTYGMSRSAMTNIYGAYGIYPEFWTVRDGQLVWSGILPETKQALAKLRQWKADDIITPEWVLGENQGGYWAVSHDFVNGKIGYSSHGMSYHWNPDMTKETGGAPGDNVKMTLELNPNAEIGYGQPPIGPEGKFGNITPDFIGTTYLAFGKNAEGEKKHRIMQIWDAIYGEFDTWLAVKWGEEGVHFEKGPDGVSVVRTEEYKTNDAQAKAGLNITFAPLDQPDFRMSISNPKGLEMRDELFVWEGAGYSNALKSALPSEGKYMQNLLKLQEDTFTAIINGEKPLEYFDEFVKMWKADGGDQLTEEANQWYSTIR
jgi:putative aldouronate transport system substrate-binding protein